MASVRRDSKGLPIDDRGWPVMEVVDYDPSANTPTIDRAEHQRLKDAVVEAAKAWRREENAFPYSIRKANADYAAFLKAVDALKAFETSHAIGQKDG